MISFDSLTLKLFTEENKDFLIGSKIQKIQQPKRNELIFFLRNKNESKKFYINFNPDYHHLCFMSEENEAKRDIIIPQKAPMFCMLLRKYIQNGKIINVIVPDNERILELYFDYYDELNEKIQLCLAVELMGKYSNVILYNYDTNVIIGCAHNVSSEKSRDRELYGMLPYVYPPKQKKKNLLKVSFESFFSNIDKDDISGSISNSYKYLTMAVVNEFWSQTQSYEKLYQNLKDFLSQKSYEGYISKDCSKYFLFPFKDSKKCNSINEMIDEYYAYNQNEKIKLQLKSKIIKYIQAQLKKLNTLKTKQTEQINKSEKAIKYKNTADIIMSNLYSLKEGMKKAELYDFEGNKIIVELDETKTPKENANKLYNLYKKTKAAYEHAQIMITDTESQIMYFEETAYYTNNAKNIDELKEIYNEINEAETSKKEIKNENIDFIEYEGYKIYIGKNKKQNDYILSKLSSGEDIWFHSLNAPGAHVLIKNPLKKQKIEDNVLLKAAQITKEYSGQKNNSKTSVIYTKRKYVNKASKKTAFVTYKNEVEIII